jgi:phosphatidylserine/phosphatidylglycerophosphate/cardiolipin synthase-like enzyme
MSNTPLRARDFTFYNRPQYFSELVRLCDKCGECDRIVIASMSFEPAQVSKLMTAMAEASKRGAEVTLIFDAYAITYAIRGPLRVGAFVWPGVDPVLQARKHRAISNTIAFLRAAGVRCAVTNQPRSPISPPFVGRSHIKTAIINNRVFIGGINLHQPSYSDEMTSFVHSATADWLYAHMIKLAAQPHTTQAFGTKDLTFHTDSQTNILLDVGLRNQSVILENALDVIEHAKKWLLITCQYFPNGKTAEALKRAHERGVNVHIIYNKPQKHGIVELPAQFASESRERLRLPQQLFRLQLPSSKPFLHAKVLASEHEAIVGSHNYISAGVTFGTAELALRRQDSQFARNAAQCILDQVQLSSLLS